MFLYYKKVHIFIENKYRLSLLVLLKLIILKTLGALATVAQWIECQPMNQRLADEIPSPGHPPGLRPGPQRGAHERQLHIDISLPLSPSLPLSKNQNKIFKKLLKNIGNI